MSEYNANQFLEAINNQMNEDWDGDLDYTPNCHQCGENCGRSIIAHQKYKNTYFCSKECNSEYDGEEDEIYCVTCEDELNPNDLIYAYDGNNIDEYQCEHCFDLAKEEAEAEEDAEEDEEEEIIFCCYECDREIIKDSKDHNEAGSCNGKDWLCMDCMCDLENDETGLILVNSRWTRFHNRYFYNNKNHTRVLEQEEDEEEDEEECCGKHCDETK